MIARYSLKLDRTDCSHPYLVKEQSLEYACDCLNKPEKVVDMLNDCFHLNEMAEEYTYLVVMDAAGHSTGVFELSHGTICEAPIGLREIFVRVLLSGGACFLMAHNHPSGQIDPSREDRKVCSRIKKAADLMGIKMVDFIIVGCDCYFSFTRNDML